MTFEDWQVLLSKYVEIPERAEFSVILAKKRVNCYSTSCILLLVIFDISGKKSDILHVESLPGLS